MQCAKYLALFHGDFCAYSCEKHSPRSSRPCILQGRDVWLNSYGGMIMFKIMRSRSFMLSAAAIIFLSFSILLKLFLSQPAISLPHISVITTCTPFSAAVLLAKERGWFSAAGIDVTVIQRSSGKEALAELIDGVADYATAADTPIMFALLKSPPVKMVATLSLSTDMLTMVARRDRGIQSSLDLQGKRIGFAMGTSSQYFLDTFLEFRAIKADAVMRIPLKPDELVQSLVDGKVDAIAAWTPLNYQAMEALGDKSQELHVGNIFRWSWNLVARNESIARNATTQRLLTALARASQALNDDPQTCARELAPILGISPEHILQTWDNTLFDVTLDQSLLLSLELQARWAMGTGLIEQKEVPNFLPAISSQALRSVDSRAVTLIDGDNHP